MGCSLSLSIFFRLHVGLSFLLFRCLLLSMVFFCHGLVWVIAGSVLVPTPFLLLFVFGLLIFPESLILVVSTPFPSSPVFVLAFVFLFFQRLCFSLASSGPTSIAP